MTGSGKFNFKTVGPEDYDRIYAYTSVYGEGSTQHSPVSMYSLQEKYGDETCEQDGFLYTLRSHLCDPKYRVYLAPLGGGNKKDAYAWILKDAASHGQRVKFVTLTEKVAADLEQYYPGRFEITGNRDLAEYFYRSKAMSTFSGGKMARLRWEANAFRKRLGERVDFRRIVPQDFPEILDFEEKWLAMSEETHDMDALRTEARMIRKQIAHYDALRLSGAVLRIDGAVEGFSYGTGVSRQVYDVLVEKVNRDIPHIAKVLRQEATRLCAMDYEYVNMEEDVGVPGLRFMKENYHPEYMLHKYIATERA